MAGRQKLELTGLTRIRRLRFELRILLKNPVCHYHAKQQAMDATVGMYGGLQGIAGKSLQEIEVLEFAAIEGPHGSQQVI